MRAMIRIVRNANALETSRPSWIVCQSSNILARSTIPVCSDSKRSIHLLAAVDMDHLPGHECTGVTGKKQARGSDLIGGSIAMQRNRGPHFIGCLMSVLRPIPLGIDGSRRRGPFRWSAYAAAHGVRGRSWRRD